MLLARASSHSGSINLLATRFEWDDGYRRLDDGTSIGVNQADLMLEILESSPGRWTSSRAT